ncbi:MAG: hypothetical protein IJL91_06515 [Bacteroidales bacterium]|nr:hypothetical protein [Bacteroidales bacterium]
MRKIVYLIGAGASRGKRDDNKLSFNTHKFIPSKGNIEGHEECANILSGVPIVNEIPGRMQWFLQKLWDRFNNQSDKSENCTLKRLINDVEWLADNAAKHASIDTFAKKLYLTKNNSDYLRLKKGLITFLNYEQMVNPPDSRYDSFLASILLDNKDDFPDEIAIVSWNYDVQFELAYREYYIGEGLGHLSYFLNVYDKNCDSSWDGPYKGAKGFHILKLNGSACINSGEDFFSDANDAISSVCSIYEKINDKNCRLSFAWERMRQQYEQRIEDCVKDAQIMVVIGYSFPFFNRSVDRLIFRKMDKLEKIYIQDLNPENVKQSLRSALTEEELTSRKMMNRIESISVNDNQFFLPPEL